MFIIQLHISLQIKLSSQVLEQYLPASASVVGEALTEQVLTHVRQQNLGYFPAIDFLQQQGLLEQDLIDTAETIGWFAARMAREEVQKKLRPFFSKLEFQSVKSNAFGLPSVRPCQPDAWQALVRHYSPDQVKIDLLASVLKKHDKPTGMANWARQLFRRKLQASFESVEVTAVSLLN